MRTDQAIKKSLPGQRPKIICVDPRLTEAARKADLWLQIRPGTDGALLMSWLNVIINEELFDREFVTHWTNACSLVESDGKRMLRGSDLTAGGSTEKLHVLPRNRKI
jgi:anaerobic selenocysteine-containing dehydrogenase